MSFDRGPNAQGRFNLGGNTHLALANPGDTSSARLDSVIKDFTAYQSRGAAIWARGEHHIFDGLKIADSAIGYTHAYPGAAPFHGDYTSKVVNSLFVGDSDNKGTPKTPAEIAYGRTLPRADADYPMRGYEYYDFLHHVVSTKFVNFQDNAARTAGAISYLLYTSFPVSSNNSVERVTVENAKPVYFPPPERRWSFSGEFNSFSGWNGAVFKDIDGSLGGGPNSYIVIDNGIAAAADDKDCRIEPTWGAAVCNGDLGRLTINTGGGGRGAGAGAGRGGPGAPAVAPGGAPGGAPGAARGNATGAVAAGGGAPGAQALGAQAPGAQAAGAAAGRGGRAGGGGRGGAAATPIVLSRNGRNFTVTGATNVRAGTEIKAQTEAPTVSINVSELEIGPWVIFELPGFSTAATRTAQNSLDALRSATSTSYYKGAAHCGSRLSRRVIPVPLVVVAAVVVVAETLSRSTSRQTPHYDVVSAFRRTEIHAEVACCSPFCVLASRFVFRFESNLVQGVQRRAWQASSAVPDQSGVGRSTESITNTSTGARVGSSRSPSCSCSAV